MKRVTSLIAAVVLAASVVTASADMVIYTTSTPIPASLTDWSGSLLFQQFDSSLGTLNSVELNLSSTLSTTLAITNEADSSSSGTVKTELQVTVQDAGHNLTAPEIDLLSPTFAYSLGAGDGTTSGLLTSNSVSDLTYTLGSILAEFTGGGNISLNASTFTQTLLANTGGNTAAGQVTDASLTGTVTYNYTPIPVPEPATFGLLALGLGALPLLRRRQ